MTGVRPWRTRLAARRSRIQWALLVVVLAVSVLSATLLATLYLLASATETYAARAALTNVAEADVQVTLRISANGSLEDILAGADDAAAELLGDVPREREAAAQSGWLKLPREGRSFALTYVGYNSSMDDLVTVQSGRTPQPSDGGDVQVLVPTAMALDLGLEVGDSLPMQPLNRKEDPAPDVIVAGTYTVNDPSDPAWQLDRLKGAAYDPVFEVPGSGGFLTTQAYGPLIAVAQDASVHGLQGVVVTYSPSFADTSLTEVREILDRTDDLDRLATRNLGDAAKTVSVTTSLDATLGGVAGSLAVTRSSVLVTGLLLMVLSVAALSQTARLMAERRYAEQHLMIARGGSGRQLFRLGFMEAIALGAVTTVVAAPLARLAYLALAETPVMANAGMSIDPGIPPLTWAVTGIVGVTLIAILVAPLMRRQGTFVDAEQARSRPGRRAAFQRSGLDIAVLALAVLAYWQLKNYKSPVLASGGVATVDPLLAAGPALALLAGALLAVRLIPPASKALEAVAARGRKAVGPLAAWEVGRRSGRAISAILLLTLAVSIGTFAVTFLSSWHQSQEDQALYRHPPDVIVSGLESPWLAQRSQLDDAHAESLSPVIGPSANLGINPTGRSRDFSGSAVRLVATDTVGLTMLGVSRLNEIGGERIASVLGDDVPAETDPIEIPGTPQQLAMDVVAESSQDIGEVQAVLRAVLRNADGDYQTVDMGQANLDGEVHHLVGDIASTADLVHYEGPLYLVGVQISWVPPTDEDAPEPEVDPTWPLSLTVSIDGLQAQTPTQVIPVEGVPDIMETQPLEVPAGLTWNATNNGVGINSVEPDGDQIHARAVTTLSIIERGGAGLVLTAAERSAPLGLVANARAMTEGHFDVGDEVVLQVDATRVNAYIAERVPAVAGETLGTAAVVANIAGLEMAVIQAGGVAATPYQWWADVADPDLDAYAASLPDDAQMTSRVGLTQELKNDPVRVAIQAALWLVTGAAVLLAALGFAVHAIVTVRAREVELAQMRAIGVQRGQLLRIVASENALLSLLGLVFGVGLGVALSFLVAPLVSVGPDGRPPLPPVIVQIPWAAVGLLTVEVALVLLVSVIIVGLLLRRIRPAEMLRMGDER